MKKESDLLKTDGKTDAGTRPLSVAFVWLEAFRNYANQTTELAAWFNILTGRNAQGKTNFLEALYLVSTGRLLRGQRDSEAILSGCRRAQVTVELLDSETRLGVVLEAGVRKRAAVNGLFMPRASDLIGRLPCVCITAEDMDLVKGDPAGRRLFLDLELCSLSPAYLRHLTLYKRALEQRNALLRDSRDWMQPKEIFEPWEEQMAMHGAAIRTAREEFVGRLSAPASEVHARMGEGERVELAVEHKDAALDQDALLRGLFESRSQDVQRGGTSVGPHRDDLRIDVSGREARLYGSQGQQRTAVISIKLACLQVSREAFGVPPLLLLDDILSDLDESRRRLLAEVVLETAGQAVLTCTEASAAGSRILERAKLFSVDNGQVSEI